MRPTGYKPGHSIPLESHMEFFDQFDICEAWSLWAHDWGEYNAIARLNALGFRPRPNLAYENLYWNAQRIYDALNARSTIDPDWYAKHQTARTARAMLHTHNVDCGEARNECR
jgi:hypothetical protein